MNVTTAHRRIQREPQAIPVEPPRGTPSEALVPKPVPEKPWILKSEARCLETGYPLRVAYIEELDPDPYSG